MTGLQLRVAPINEHRCRRCGKQIAAEFPICPACAEAVARFDAARRVLEEQQAARERPWPAPRRPFVDPDEAA